MTEHERRKEKRKQDRLERLGSNNPSCLICGEDDPACLELHHLAGRIYGDDKIIVCTNCHKKLTERQKDHPPVQSETPNSLECRGHLLLGTSDVLELLKTPAQLIEQIRQTAFHLIDYGQAFRPRDEEREE